MTGLEATGVGAEKFSVLYLSSLDWDFRRQDHQLICIALASAGHRVVYVENTGARIPGLRDLARLRHRIGRLLKPRAAGRPSAAAGLEIVTPFTIPGGSSRIERWFNRVLLMRTLAPRVRALTQRRLVLWVGLPTWSAVDLCSTLRPDAVVYYCGDLFTQIPGLRHGIVESERALIARADVVFATSASLADHCAELGARPVTVPVMIDLENSRAAREGLTPVPEELVELKGRLIGYMGGLNFKVDVRLLEAVARAFPEDTLVILGSVEDPRFLPHGPNITILGERPYALVPAYLARFEVCLIPYVVTEFTESVYPAKLLEYLAMGRSVVSTPLAEVKPFASLLRLAADERGFVTAVGEALVEPQSEHARVVRTQAVADVTQEAFRRMLAEVDRALLAKSQ